MPDYSNINDLIHEEVNDFLYDIFFNLGSKFDADAGLRAFFESEKGREPKENPTLSDVAQIDKAWAEDVSDTDEFEENLHYHIDGMLTYYGVVQDIYFNSFWSNQIQESDTLSGNFSDDKSFGDYSGYGVIMRIMQEQIYTWASEHFREEYEKWRDDKDKSSWLIDYLVKIDAYNRDKWEDVIYEYYNDKVSKDYSDNFPFK